MKHFVFALLALAPALADARDTYVKPYTRSDGTYVQGHYRSAPDGKAYNNYSTHGNTNPYTGQAGTVKPSNSYVAPNRQSGYAQPPLPPNCYKNGYGALVCN